MKTVKVLCIMLCLALTLTVTSCEKEDKIMENYPGITDNKHIIKELSLKELTEKISNQETFVVVLGFPECPWCQALMPEVNEVGKELDLDEAVYYSKAVLNEQIQKISAGQYTEQAMRLVREKKKKVGI